MLSERTIDQKFIELKFILSKKDKQFIKMDAHGGYSVLLIYPPEDEILYLERIENEYSNAHFIDVSKLFVEHIDSIGLEDFVRIYDDYKSEPQKLFKSGSSEDDFFRHILNEIESAGKESKLPILIRTGALYGTGIENINIMDSPVIQKLTLPLVILYPATVGGDKRLRFLNFKMASDYRAVVIY